MGYALRPGVTFTRISGRTIFLDAVQDRYFCLAPEAEMAFSALLEPSGIDPTALALLVRDNLLNVTDSDDLPRPCVGPPSAVTSVFDEPQAARPGATLAMARQLVLAEAAVRTMSFARLLNRVKRRKQRVTSPPANPERRLREIAGALRRTATIVSPLNRCLPRSLATAHRMLDQRMRPTMVLGVKLGPFEAHCWVQHDATLVNDRLDDVRRFSPILVI
jgi:hypothetical protein